MVDSLGLASAFNLLCELDLLNLEFEVCLILNLGLKPEFLSVALPLKILVPVGIRVFGSLKLKPSAAYNVFSYKAFISAI